MERDLIAKLLENVTRSPETALPLIFNKEIKNYISIGNFDTIVSFVRNLLDKINMYGGCSKFVINVLELTIKDEPEEDSEQSLFRRQCAGLADFDDYPPDSTLEITRVEVPRSNPSWPAVSR